MYTTCTDLSTNLGEIFAFIPTFYKIDQLQGLATSTVPVALR
jgi:hypothetical protein